MHVVKPCVNLLVCPYSLLLKAHQIPNESSEDRGSCGSKSQVVRKAVHAGCDFRQPRVKTPALAGIGPLWQKNRKSGAHHGHMGPDPI